MPRIAPEAKDVLNCIRRLVRVLRLSDRETQEQYGLSAAQVFVLHALREEDPLTVNEIGERTATDQSSASVVIQRLVDRGYLKRTVNPEDRRSVLLSLTRRGRALMRRSPSTAQEKIFASVSKMSQKDRTAFVKLLERFLSGMGVTSEAEAPMLFENGSSSPRPPRRRRASPKARA